LEHLLCGLLGDLGVSCGKATALHQDKTSDPLWRIEVPLQHHATAHAMSNEDRWLQSQGVQEGAEVGAKGFNAAVFGGAIRSAMAT
jgi:hypothetical protein